MSTKCQKNRFRWIAFQGDSESNSSRRSSRRESIGCAVGKRRSCRTLGCRGACQTQLFAVRPSPREFDARLPAPNRAAPSNPLPPCAIKRSPPNPSQRILIQLAKNDPLNVHRIFPVSLSDAMSIGRRTEPNGEEITRTRTIACGVPRGALSQASLVDKCPSGHTPAAAGHPLD
jgi:hypothetical protein